MQLICLKCIIAGNNPALQRSLTKVRKFWTSICASTGAYFTAHADELQKQVEESSAAAATVTAFIMQLQETAKKAAKEAALLKDLQEGQEDNVMTYNGFYDQISIFANFDVQNLHN